MANAEGKVIYERTGVFIHTQVSSEDEDALIQGKVIVISKPEGTFVEWKQTDVKKYDLDKDTNEKGEWAMVNSVSYKNSGIADEDGDVITMQPKQRHKYIVNFDVNDLKSFKRSSPTLGWSYLIFILRDGTTFPALHFHQGGTKALVKELIKYVHITKSPTDHRLYLVKDHDPSALTRSFDELNLFAESSTDLVTKFFDNPYSSTMTGFSKVTNFLKDTLLLQEQTKERPKEEVASVVDEELQGMEINEQSEPGFEVITKVELPPRQDIKRLGPLTAQQWVKHKDEEGRIKNVDELKETIFRGGVESVIRSEVWKFLLGYYDWNSTRTERTECRKKKVDDYFRMKLQWKSVSEDQERRFSVLRERSGLIDKDVTRTDRIVDYFKGENNANLTVLNDILMTYCMYNFDLGYVQGMSDLLAPILLVMDNEVDAFWCFSGFMDLVGDNFEMSQQGMKTQLSQLHMLLKYTDIELHNYLDAHDSSNMFFCFRWVLIIFKREFNFPDIMRLWEVFWTGLPCKNFQLLMSLAVLDMQKHVLMENNFGFTEILKHTNDMSCQIDVEDTMKTAEAIYLQLSQAKNLPQEIKDILGIENDVADSSEYDTPLQTPDGACGEPLICEISPPSAIEKEFALPVKTDFFNTPSEQGSYPNTTATTPDDDSIEILDEIIAVLT